MKKRSSIVITIAVVFALILREVRGRLYANRIGAFWILFEPILHVVLLVTLFSFIRRGTTSGFEIITFLVVGIVPFLMMKNISLKSMEAVNANKALFAYRQIKPLDTIVSRTLVEFMLSACVYIIIMSALGIFGRFDVGIAHPLEWLLIVFVAVMFAFSIGLLFCIAAEAHPAVKPIFRLIFMPLYFISGVLYPLRAIPESFLQWMLWNPYLHIIDQLRWSIFEGYYVAPGVTMSYPAALTLLFLCIALGVYRVRRLHLVAT